MKESAKGRFFENLYGNLEHQIEIVKLNAMLKKERQKLSDREAPSSPVADNAGPRPVPMAGSLHDCAFVH